MDLREQAVLSRTSHDTDLLELELTRRRIPYVKYGGLRYLEAAHVKDFIALLRLADNPGDEISWFRVLQLVEGVGPATARRALDVLMAAPVPDRLAYWPTRARSASRAGPSARRRRVCGAAGDERGGKRRCAGRAAARRARAADRGALSGRRAAPARPRAACRRGPRVEPRSCGTSSASWCSTRPSRAPTWPGRRTSTRTIWCSPPSTPPRASNGRPCTCWRCTTATSRPTWLPVRTRASTRSAGCCTSR